MEKHDKKMIPKAEIVRKLKEAGYEFERAGQIFELFTKENMRNVLVPKQAFLSEQEVKRALFDMDQPDLTIDRGLDR